MLFVYAPSLHLIIHWKENFIPKKKKKNLPKIKGIYCCQDIILQTIDLQCKWVARVLSGRVQLPKEKEMMAYVEEYYKQMEQNGVPKRYTHYLHFKEVLISDVCLASYFLGSLSV